MSIKTQYILKQNLLQYHLWIFPIVGYLLYIIAFLTGFFLDITFLNIAGVLLFFMLVLIGNYRHLLSIRKDRTVYLAVMIIAMPILTFPFHHYAADVSYMIKHILLYGSYILLFSYGLPPLYQRYEKTYLIRMLLLIFCISLLAGRSFIREEEVRLSGVFTDPNNLSLMALSFLFFIDEESDSTKKKLGIYAVVVSLLAITATSGAILAFVAGMAYKFRKLLLKRSVLVYSILLLMALLVMASELMEVQAVMRTITQMNVAFENLHLITEQSDLDFGSLAAEHSQTSLSGLWRLFHWTKAISMYGSAPPLVILFGYGIGTSMDLLGNVPHNEYLRVLFEQGITGLLLFVAFYATIFRRIDRKYIHVVLMIAVFSFTQNVIENMLFMILFMLYLTTAQQVEDIHCQNGTRFEKEIP